MSKERLSQKSSSVKPPFEILGNEILFFLKEDKGRVVYLVGDFNHWEKKDQVRYNPLFQGYAIRLQANPNGVYAYKWVVDDQWILDPCNRDTCENGPFGTNSMVKMPGYREAWEIYERQDVGKGSLIRHEVDSKSLKEKREVFVYLPYGYDAKKSYPLVVFQDGKECVDHLPAARIFDNLIGKNVVSPFVSFLVSPKNPKAREKEYSFNAKFEKFLGEEVLSWGKSLFSISSKKEERAIFGFSLGGLVSVRTAIHYPSSYGVCGGESCAFWPKNFRIYEEIPMKKPLDLRFYLGAGDLDGGQALMDAMGTLFSKMGILHQVHFGTGGHDWFYWKTHLRHCLFYFNPWRP